MLPILLITLIFVYFIYAAHVLDLHRPALEALCKPVGEWFGKAGNPVTAIVIAGSLIMTLIAWVSPHDSLLYDLRGEITGMAFSVSVIDLLVGYRNRLQEKKRIIQQLGSKSNAHALDAARIIVEEGWHKDGSLVGANFTGGNLTTVKLYNANLADVNLSWANLEGAELIKVNFKGADLTHANLTGAWLVEADLREAVLTSTNLTNAKLLNAKLDGAKLVNTNIVETGFIWASFKGAKLEFANIMIAQTPVDYSNLLAPGFKGAVYDANTTFPKNFIPEAAGAFKMDD